VRNSNPDGPGAIRNSIMRGKRHLGQRGCSIGVKEGNGLCRGIDIAQPELASR